MQTVQTAVRDTAPAARASSGARRLTFADLRESLAEGWSDFLAKPSHNFLLGLIYPLVGFLLIRATSGGPTLPLIWPLISGFALVGPVATIGLMELSRRRELGETPGWRDALAPFGRPGGGAALRISLALFALLAAWLATAQALSALILGDAEAATPAAFAGLVFGSAEGWLLILLGNAVGALFAAAVLLIGAFSLPLALDGERSARRAMAGSVRAGVGNLRVMAVWGALVGSVLVASIALGLVGLAVTLPVLAHANWRLHRRAFGPRRSA
ncbi:MAG: DUF2189 domain-containing protein [Paracoccaceae bacterium]